MDASRAVPKSKSPKDMCGDHQWRADVTRRCSGHDNRVSRFGVRQHLSKLSVVVDQSRRQFVEAGPLLGRHTFEILHQSAAVSSCSKAVDASMGVAVVVLSIILGPKLGLTMNLQFGRS